MNINDIRFEIDVFLKQNQTTKKSFESFKKNIIKKVSNDKLLTIETNFLLAMVGSFFKGEQFVGKNDINVLCPEKNNIKKTQNSKELKTENKSSKPPKKQKIERIGDYLLYNNVTKTIKHKIPRSKNKITVEEAELLVLERKFINKKFNIRQLADNMNWEISSLIEVLKQIDSDVDQDSKLKKNHLIFLQDQLYSRMLEIEQESIRNKVEGPKFKPNYYKLIYNAVGSKK